ncbi:MAG: hypothetical protein LBT65_03665 [Synergistaceae bacterium]|nr:hypothetical protein [Synergistaceae bacterium]
MSEENELASDVIHIVLAVYDPKGTYSRHAGVVMASIFEHTKSPVCIHILHDKTLTEHNRVLLNETAEPHGQRVAFHDVSSHMERMSRESIELARDRFSAGSLFRLLIPDVLTLEKVIYLDCDIVVNMDIRELWEVPLEGHSLAGVPNRPAEDPFGHFSPKPIRLKLVGCDITKYINSGVLFMNLSRIREKFNLVQQSDRWFKRYRHCSELPDQDLINSCFRGDIKIIESRFNNCHVHNGDISNSILHATGTPKPWNGFRDTALERLYWKTCLKTPWGRLTPDEVVDLMLDVAKDSPFTHRHTFQCYKKIFSRLRKDVLLSNPVVTLWFLLKFFYHEVLSHIWQGCR